MNPILLMRSIFLTLLAAVLIIPGIRMSAAEAKRPNIIFILADDMGYSDLGCYGGEIETPNLDSLARGGLRFTQFYNTARCWPTRGALLTGYYAQQIRRDALPEARGGGQGVRPEWARLLPEYLKAAGYRSYHSGKWHIDGDVLAGGFDRSLHTKNDGNFFTARGNFLDDKPVTPAVDESDYYVTIATADHAIDCLQDHAIDHAGKPFFQYIAFIAPHFPLHALPRDISKYRDKYLVGWDAMREARFRRQEGMGIVNTTLSAVERDLGPPYAFPDAMDKLGPGEVNRPLPWSELTSEQRRFQSIKMAIHAAMIDRMDREIGRIIGQLKSMGAFDDTLIFFASDNGASAEIMVRHGGHDPQATPGGASTYLCLGPGFSSACNTPFRRHKTWVHEGGISTPLIVHWPRGVPARNELRHTPGHVIDIVPTVLDVVGIQKPESWNGTPIPPAPGRSLVPAFVSDAIIVRDSLWWLHEGHRAIRKGDWKLVAAQGDPWELYDLTTDRAEQNNLAKGMPEKVAALEQAWQMQTESYIDLARKVSSSRSPSSPSHDSPPGIIMDTDFRSDVDDVGSLALLNALADRGECVLLGVIASQTGPQVVGAINAVNTWYGRGQVPIGLSPVDDQRFDDHYAPVIGDPERYPSTQSNSTAAESTRLYRRLLHDSKDGSVIVVVVGGQTCIHRLLISQADFEGDGTIGRSGRELIEAKVRQLVIMGGNFVDSNQREHNIMLDLEAAQMVAQSWPTSIVYSGFEIGRAVLTGGALTDPEKNPVGKAYELFPAGGIGTIASSSSFDQTALFYAVHGLESENGRLWRLSDLGRASFPEGRTQFTPDAGGRHRHLVRLASDETVAGVIEALMIQPPRRESRPLAAASAHRAN